MKFPWSIAGHRGHLSWACPPSLRARNVMMSADTLSMEAGQSWPQARSTTFSPVDAADACLLEEFVVNLISAAAVHGVDPSARRRAGPYFGSQALV